MQWILQKMLGTKNQRDIRRLMPLVQRINELELSYQKLDEQTLKGHTALFRKRLADGEALDDLLCEAFATVKNACRRLCGTTVDVCGHDLAWDMVPFDVQLVGGIVLHQGKIAEMQTGEGKTLVATMPLYLNALAGRNVHLVTTNDYLARRDATWMGHVYTYLGLTVGCIQNQMRPEERRLEYAKDITYGMNSEFGFDYLRDNGMAFRPEERVQNGYNFAIVDEVDNILIDEARTPLIISGPAPVSSHQYFELKPRVERLVRLQLEQVNRLVSDLQVALDAGDKDKAQFLMYQVAHGMPKHKKFLHMMEDPGVRKLREQVENVMLTDMRKEEARALREELYFTIDERGNDANLTERGCETLSPDDPDMYVLPDMVTAMAELDGREELSAEEKTLERQRVQQAFSERSERIHNVDQLLRAYCAYEKDVQYVVQDNQVMIVDEYTGRLMPGRRWSDGLHQAIEAKEGAKIERETQTLATITIQNYFRMYKKLAGMTGTAETEADEFHEIYKLDVVVIPTNRPIRRVDGNDVIYKTQREKYKALIEDVMTRHQKGQPVLVGTVSVETSELISRMLRRQNIPHSVLNAKNHEREAEIVMRAGQPGAVTIATNMAGRGTDIKLGEGVAGLPRNVVMSGIKLDDPYEDGSQRTQLAGPLRTYLSDYYCGLYVIGSERHEARRIDRQLRGRCARQGDPGASRFYISLEDDLMRLFGSDRISSIMSKLGLEEGQELEHRWLNRSIETAQRRVEQQHFSVRKRTLEYDDVMNKQREIIYGLRERVVCAESVREVIFDVMEDVIASTADVMLAPRDEQAQTDFREWVQTTFPIPLTADDVKSRADDRDDLASFVFERARKAYEIKVSTEDPRAMETMERVVVLQALDSHWQEYLRAMDGLRQGVGLRAYGQRDPLVEYKSEAYLMFQELMSDIKTEVINGAFKSASSIERYGDFLRALPVRMVHETPPPATGGGSGVSAGSSRTSLQQGADPGLGSNAGHLSGRSGTRNMRLPMPVATGEERIGRNDPCPCGSGKKYKKCCGA